MFICPVILQNKTNNKFQNILIFLKFFVDKVESKNIAKSIGRAEFSMIVELWCGEKATSAALSLISTRTLQLNFHPVQGLHYHLPVLFDYFHMSSIVLGIHASLIAIHNNRYVFCLYLCWHKIEPSTWKTCVKSEWMTIPVLACENWLCVRASNNSFGSCILVLLFIVCMCSLMGTFQYLLA